MSEANRCYLCGEAGDEDIKDHLRRDHWEQVDEIRNNWGDRMVEEAFSDVSPDADLTRPTSYCQLCGFLETDQPLNEHLQTVHAADRDVIRQHYGPEIDEQLFAGSPPETAASDQEEQVAEPVSDASTEAVSTASERDPDQERTSHAVAGQCKLCGDQIGESAEEEPTRDALQVHLEAKHADQTDEIAELYGQDLADSIPELAAATAPTTSTASSSQASTTETDPTRDQDTSSVDYVMTEADNMADPDSGQSNQRDNIGVRGKYAIFGVGGAGNRILDSLLMRRDTLRERNQQLADAWEGGIQTYLPLNTNDSEIVGTYYQQHDQDLSPAETLRRCGIGAQKGGAGEDPGLGMGYMKEDIDNAPQQTFDSWPFFEEDVERAQAVMFLHSVVKGTGSGATPQLAQYLREDVLTDQRVDKPMLSVTILPNEKATKFNPEATVNAGFGAGMIASTVDVMLPFDNSRLRDVADDIAPEIDYIDQVNPAYARPNRPLTQFLEAFTLSSNSEFMDNESTRELAAGEVGDNGFDVPDSFRPVANRYPLDRDHDDKPAVVAAPLFAVSEAQNVSEGSLQILVSNAFKHGLLVDCEPETAWGGAFIFYGPQDVMADVSRHIQDYTLHEIITDTLGTTELRIRPHQAVVPEVDKLHMWGLLWNPKMGAMEQMFEKTKEAKEWNNDLGKMLRENWDRIEPVFTYLGRENRV